MPNYTSDGTFFEKTKFGMPRKDHASYCTWVEEIIPCSYNLKHILYAYVLSGENKHNNSTISAFRVGQNNMQIKICMTLLLSLANIN